MLLPRTLSQHGARAGSLQVPGLCLHTAPSLSHSRKESSQAPFPHNTPSTFLLSAFGCENNTGWEPVPSSPLPVPPWWEQSHAPEPCWGTTRVCLSLPGSVCLSLQALSCVTHHTGPAPCLSPCAAVIPTHSPGFRLWCHRGARAPTHPELQEGTLLERAAGAAFPKDFLLHPSRSLAGRDRAHAPPSPPCSGCTSGQQMLPQTLAGAGDKGSRYLLPARQSQHGWVQLDLPLTRLG